MTEWLEIGTIVAPQGMNGEVRVYPNSDFPERFEEPGQRWLLRPGETEPQPIELLGGRFIPGKGIYSVELAGIEDRTQAETLRGCVLMVPESDRPQLAENEYHILDLIGLDVFNQLTGKSIGTVVAVIPAGNDLLEVKLHLPLQASAEQPKTSDADEKPTKSEKRGKSQPKPPKPETVLIPFVREIVPIVDLEAGRLEISPPPGLLEINLSSE